MKIVPVPHGMKGIGVSTGYRTPGLHISSIYNDLYQDLEPKRYTRGTTPDPNVLEAGLVWEEILEKGLKERLAERPGEIISEEGIIASPDLIIYNSSIRVGEIKLTWMSSREVPREPTNSFPPKFDKYFTQMMAYCHILDTPYARLLAFFVNGAGGFGKPAPELLAWDIEFTAREMHENWTMLIGHAKLKGML